MVKFFAATVFFIRLTVIYVDEVKPQVSKTILELLNIKTEVERLSNILTKAKGCL